MKTKTTNEPRLDGYVFLTSEHPDLATTPPPKPPKPENPERAKEWEFQNKLHEILLKILPLVDELYDNVGDNRHINADDTIYEELHNCITNCKCYFTD